MIFKIWYIFLIDYSKKIILKMSLMCLFCIVFICNIEIGNFNWFFCKIVVVFEMNLFVCETILFYNFFVWEYFVLNVLIWIKCVCFYEYVFFFIWI